MSLLLAGLPVSVAGYTVNRLCASGLQAIIHAALEIKAGYGELYIAGGVESMTRAPFVMAKSDSAFNRVPEIYDTTIGWRFTNEVLSGMYTPYSMGETAENVAGKYKITREEQDTFAYESQRKWSMANEAGKFRDEIIPISIPQRKKDPIVFNTDEHPRLSSVDTLAGLKPAFRKDGTVTAGNSSGINDGSSVLLLASGDFVKRHQLTPMARLVSSGSAGVDPSIMGIGPVPASQKALKRASLAAREMDLVELNEAFASQSLACMRELELDPGKTNVNGGSIAIGHPLGASGARITTTLLHEMKRTNGAKYGLATMCIGVGQGLAAVFEKC
jgi:acetyl-CoA C-acetyltransferase